MSVFSKKNIFFKLCPVQLMMSSYKDETGHSLPIVKIVNSLTIIVKTRNFLF